MTCRLNDKTLLGMTRAPSTFVARSLSESCGVGQNGDDPVNDHAWDFGSVSADPAPSWLAAMWTTC
jgi:hypothetical protein